MKNIKLLIIAFGIAIALSSNSQPFDYDKTHYYLDKLLYSNSSGEEGLTTYIYSPIGILYKAVWENNSDRRFSENYYYYKNGLLVHLYRKFSDSTTSVKTFEFDSNSQLTKETFIQSGDFIGSASYYYKNQHLDKLECENYNGWLTATIFYQYDSTGKRKSASIYKKEKKIGAITFTYSNGNLTKEQWDFNGKFTQTFCYQYIKKKETKYANTNPLINLPHGLKIADENYTYNNKIGGPSYFSYDESGKLIKKRFVRNDSVETNTTYLYKNDTLEKSIRKYSNGNQAIFTFHYNHFGQIIKKSFTSSNDLNGQETYLYDINGRLIAARYDKMDSWLTGTIVFNHNQFDQIISGKFTGDNGFTANIIFKNNKIGLPESITWEFSSGDFQKYFLKYE